MKLVRRNIERDQGGVLVLVPEDEEDMWHVYNLISVGDSGKKVKVRMSFQIEIDTRQMPFPVRASTIRSVTSESATGTTKKERVRLTLTLTIEDIDYDTEGSSYVKRNDSEYSVHYLLAQTQKC